MDVILSFFRRNPPITPPEPPKMQITHMGLSEKASKPVVVISYPMNVTCGGVPVKVAATFQAPAKPAETEKKMRSVTVDKRRRRAPPPIPTVIKAVAALSDTDAKDGATPKPVKKGPPPLLSAGKEAYDSWVRGEMPAHDRNAPVAAPPKPGMKGAPPLLSAGTEAFERWKLEKKSPDLPNSLSSNITPDAPPLPLVDKDDTVYEC